VEQGLRRFWFEFEVSPPDVVPRSLDGPDHWKSIQRLRNGVGVTGYDEADCLGLIQANVMGRDELPPIRRVVPDVDVSTLDEGHVLGNLGVPVWRGIWYPKGYGVLPGM
jgi:hypothetical protein